MYRWRDGYTTYACSRVSGKRVELGIHDNFTSYVSYEVAGEFVGYSYRGCSRNTDSFPFCRQNEVGLVDARRGKRVVRERFADDRNTRSLVVSAQGVLGWIDGVEVPDGSGRLSGSYTVRLADRNGVSELGRGADIDAGSLALARDHMYWTQAGLPRSAMVAPLGAPAASRQRVEDQRVWRRCARSGSTTVFSGATFRIYRTPGRANAEPPPTYVLCYLRTGNRLGLGSARATALRPVATTGNVVAYQRWTLQGKHAVSFTIASRSLRTRRVLHSWSGTSGSSTKAFYGADDLAVTSSGAMGWIVPFNSNDFTPVTYEVRKSDSNGEAVVVDVGRDVEPQSLAVAGQTLYWTKGGRPRFVTLS